VLHTIAQIPRFVRNFKYAWPLYEIPTLHLENFINVETQLFEEFISQKDKISRKEL